VSNYLTAAATTLMLASALSSAPASAQTPQEDSGDVIVQTATAILQSLCVGNQGPLSEQPMDGLLYLQAVVGPLHDPGLAWRIPPEVRLFELDAMLPAALNTRMMSSPEFFQDSMDFGLDAFAGMLGGLAGAREQNMATGDFDPAGETAAMMQGLIGGMGGIGSSAVMAGRDADVMIALLSYEDTIGTFRACYSGIRAAVMGTS
jgi:hypothetical protein